MTEVSAHSMPAVLGEGCGPTRERLLDVAERLFSERGFAATSVRNITADAGCNLAAVNYHFGGKDQLYEEVFRRRLGVMREQRLGSIRRILAARGDAALEDLLRAFAIAFLEPLLAATDGRLCSALMSRELLEPHLPPGLFVREIITPVHEELAAALIPACPGLDREAARRCTHSLVGQLVHFMRLERWLDSAPDESADRFPLPALVDHVVGFSAAGIRAAAGS
jgi:TetR/AcrR family transcriptional regulator, regulator of cefoperazone and chloramphenicol sensitivity